MPKDALNILFLNSWYPNRNSLTLGNFVQKHAEAAARFENVVCLSIFPAPGIDSVETSISFQNDVHSIVVYFPEVKVKIPGLKQLIKWRRYKKAFEIGLQQVEKHFDQIDLVHLNVAYPLGIFARLLKKKKGIPYVLTEHSTAYHDPAKRFGAKQLPLIKRVLADAAIILPVSNDLGRSINALCSKPMQRVTNVVDPGIFAPVQKEGSFTLIHISTLNQAHKNPQGILRATKAVIDGGVGLQLTFISDFPSEDVQKYAEKLGFPKDDLRFLGPLDTAEVASELSKAHALVLFSNYENFPCVIAEAFMSGVPVITSDVNGIPEYVNESNGIMVKPMDEEALAAAILSLAQNREKYDPAALRNYAIEHFSYDSIGKQFSEIYHQTLKQCGVK